MASTISKQARLLVSTGFSRITVGSLGGSGAATPGTILPGLGATGDHAGEFYRQGDYWTVAYGGERSLVRDRKGLHYLAGLLAYPYREIHVLVLVNVSPAGRVCLNSGERVEWSAPNCRSDSSAPFSGLGHAGEHLDPQATKEYRQRLREMAEDLAHAKRVGNEPLALKLDEEKAALERELHRAFGLNGRPRVAASVAERARVNITRSLKLAIDTIGTMNSVLGTHLRGTVRTGYFCEYRPAPNQPVSWRL